MNLQEIKTAVQNGKTVCCGNESYIVICDKNNQWLIKCLPNGHCIGLTHTDEKTLNGKEEEFYILEAPETTDQAEEFHYWDMVEKYYPNYSHSQDIATANDYDVLVDDEAEEGSHAEKLRENLLKEYDTPDQLSNFDIFVRWKQQQHENEILQATIKAMHEVIRRNSSSIAWSTEDIFAANENLEEPYEITYSQAVQIVNNVIKFHDATIGINWDVINEHIHMFFSKSKKS